MTRELELNKRFKMTFDRKSYRRIIGNCQMVVHCHHYNTILQHAIETASQIDGKSIILSSAEEVFSSCLLELFTSTDSTVDKWIIASAYYSHIGFGTLDFSHLDKDIVISTDSHFVEGWNAAFPRVSKPVCTFTQGYLQGVIYSVTGKLAWVTETQCMAQGDRHCQFHIDWTRNAPIEQSTKKDIILKLKPFISKDYLQSPHVDSNRIVDAVAHMSIIGNKEGLIPAFSSYLAHMPADFYNFVSLRFIEAMSAVNMCSTGRRLLLYAGEICGINTFYGIKNSLEWEGLIAPMIQSQEDNIFALISVSNALGWGNWNIKSYDPGNRLVMESLNGYEAIGYLEIKQPSEQPQCFMLSGVASGLMALEHAEGSVEERFGMFESNETSCICCSNTSCLIEVNAL